MLSMTAPGQGAQAPGFLTPWLELPGAPERLAHWSELAKIDLIRMGTTADAGQITDTAVAQPLLVAAALLAGELLGKPDMVAGHSVGELAAGALGGVVSSDEAIRLAAVRGRAMARAAQAKPTGMIVVLGGDRDVVEATIARHGLIIANINAADQIVAGGTQAQLNALEADPPPGARLRQLRVAGAFHTVHMASAVDALASATVQTTVQDPELTVLSNRNGAVITSGQEWLERIVAQIAAPVRWDLCMDTMARLGATDMVELPPAGVLTGMAKRIWTGGRCVALKTPEQLATARQLLC